MRVGLEGPPPPSLRSPRRLCRPRVPLGRPPCRRPGRRRSPWGASSTALVGSGEAAARREAARGTVRHPTVAVFSRAKLRGEGRPPRHSQRASRPRQAPSRALRGRTLRRTSQLPPGWPPGTKLVLTTPPQERCRGPGKRWCRLRGSDESERRGYMREASTFTKKFPRTGAFVRLFSLIMRYLDSRSFLDAQPPVRCDM